MRFWQRLTARWPMWAIAGCLIVIGSPNAFAATVTVPFVGCPSNIQGTEQAVPSGPPKVVTLDPGVARQLAYYAPDASSGIFAPRGWFCEGNGGSSQFTLRVSPTADDSGNGPAVISFDLTGDYPNREELAQYALKLFPAEGRAAVKQLSDTDDYIDESDFDFRPYPNDRLTYLEKHFLLFETPAHTIGLGTSNFFKPSALPISGYFDGDGVDGGADLLQIRLPKKILDLRDTILRLDEPTNAPVQIIDMDLSKSFNARSPWRLVVGQGPDIYAPHDTSVSGLPKGDIASKVPGPINLCLQNRLNGPCDADLVAMAQPSAPLPSNAWEPHYLNLAALVFPHGQTGAPLLLLQTASAHRGNGDQAVFTQLLAYDRTGDCFVVAYAHVTGRNNNQEVRFISSGPLQGRVITVEPTSDAPFGYWVTVNALTPAFAYKQILRYRSATRYNDHNSLSVIDSEMPNIERHLGLWHPGLPLPLPSSGAHACLVPRLSHMELWCG